LNVEHSVSYITTHFIHKGSLGSIL